MSHTNSLSLRSAFAKYITNISYSISLVVSMIATYGYFLTHYAVSIDDLSSDRYYYGELFAQGRFTSAIIHHLFGFIDNSQWIRDLFGLVLLALSAIIFCIIIDKYISFKSILPKTVFSCLLVTAPIYAELFSYNGTCISIGGGFLCVALALYITTVSWQAKDYKRLIGAVLLMAVAASWYESLLIVYVEAVFALLILEYIGKDEKTPFKKVILQGLYFAIPLVLGVVVELIFQFAAWQIFDIEKSLNTTNTIKWLSGTNEGIVTMVMSLFMNYFVAAFWNKTIAVFLVSVLLCVALCIYYCVKKKSATPLFLFFFLFFVNFALSFVSGEAMGYRMCQSFAFFTAFLVLVVFFFAENLKVRFACLFRKILCVLAAYLVILQISTSNYWYFWDYQRYQEEESVIKQISSTLVDDYDISKPVVFTGYFELSENILDRTHLKTDDASYKMLDKVGKMVGIQLFKPIDEKHVRKTSQTICSSYIKWGMITFEGNNEELFKFIRYHGIDYLKNAPLETVEKARKEAEDMPKWPQKGSICDMGEYIIVNF